MDSSKTDGAGSALAGDSPAERAFEVAVVGNPNAGKTTLFNRLTGMSQTVGNYPGVTVEKKEGRAQIDDLDVHLIDLPGTYSLAAHSPDEKVTVDVLLGLQPGTRRPDLVVDVVDASNLERNLYLFSQLLEIGIPVVLVLNMRDVAERHGVEIDTAQLSKRLGVPIVETRAQKGVGVSELRDAIADACRRSGKPDRCCSSDAPTGTPTLPPALEAAVRDVLDDTNDAANAALGRGIHPFEALRALVDANGVCARCLSDAVGPDFEARLAAAREAVGSDSPLVGIEAQARYEWVRTQLDGCVHHKATFAPRFSERLDHVLTHKVFGVVILAGVLVLLFQAITAWADPLMGWVEAGQSWLGGAVGGLLPEGILHSLVVDGIIAGVGGVIIFLPQILLLFLFIAILEDCGYMARAAFLMDRLLAKCGLSGKSFIPMLSGFACAVPGVMAARVIEDRRDRLATILITPLMTCSARLPVYTILSLAFIPNTPIVGELFGLQALVLLGLYALGIVVAVAVAWLLKVTLLRGEAPPFLLELPSYKLPVLSTILLRLYDRGKAFVVRAGTVILAITIVVWALGYFPRSADTVAPFEARRTTLEAELAAVPDTNAEERQRLAEEIAAVDHDEMGAHVRQSYLGRIGKTVEPVFAPLGWDWRISMATIAAFPAREVVVSTLGTVYNLGDEEDEESESLRQKLREAKRDGTGEPAFSVPVALSIMVFFALCCQCGATLATIRRETGSWGWALFTFVYMTGLAYAAAFLTYQIGTAIAGGSA